MSSAPQQQPSVSRGDAEKLEEIAQLLQKHAVAGPAWEPVAFLRNLAKGEGQGEAVNWSEQWTLGAATRAGAADSDTVALGGPTIYGQQEVEVVPKAEAEQQIERACRSTQPAVPQCAGDGLDGCPGCSICSVPAVPSDLSGLAQVGEVTARELLEALEVAALGGYDEELLDEETVADPHEVKGLVKVTQDYSGEYSCHWTPAGIEFIRTTLAKAHAIRRRSEPSDLSGDGEAGLREALEAEVEKSRGQASTYAATAKIRNGDLFRNLAQNADDRADRLQAALDANPPSPLSGDSIREKLLDEEAVEAAHKVLLEFVSDPEELVCGATFTEHPSGLDRRGAARAALLAALDAALQGDQEGSGQGGEG